MSQPELPQMPSLGDLPDSVLGESAAGEEGAIDNQVPESTAPAPRRSIIEPLGYHNDIGEGPSHTTLPSDGDFGESGVQSGTGNSSSRDQFLQQVPADPVLEGAWIADVESEQARSQALSRGSLSPRKAR